jgi:DinB superfamily/Mycothiol maleylpyruvate isomerase N-terminal domain
LTVDLRRAALGDLRAIDFRAGDRDFFADGRAILDRFSSTWAGLGDAAWRLSGASRSDAGGPDWSYRDHVAHLAGWAELGIEMARNGLESGRWPADQEFDGGDFDHYNETLRERWQDIQPAEIRNRFQAATALLTELSGRLKPEVLRGDDAWGWIYLTLHGHQLDHLGVVEPWTERLRERQVEGDPFGPDPMIGTGDEEADQAAFWAEEADIFAAFSGLLDSVPAELQEVFEVTPDWSLKDHLAHVGSWFEEGAGAIDEHLRGGGWRSGPAEGLDAWNARNLEALRPLPWAELRHRLEQARQRIRAAAHELDQADFRSADGWDWTYWDLAGHVRSHLAMVAPWCVRTGWPAQ